MMMRTQTFQALITLAISPKISVLVAMAARKTLFVAVISPIFEGSLTLTTIKLN